MIRLIATYIGIAVLSLGCQSQGRHEPRGGDDGAVDHATTGPAPVLATFDAPGIKLSHPADWPRSFSDDRVVILEVLGTSSPSSYAVVSLEIPKLPPHLPGLIPLRLVVNGYIDDLKKQQPDIQVGTPEALKVAGASARRVRSQWELNGATNIEDAVLAVHGDRVYIFLANAEATDEQAAREALDQVLETVTWK